MALRVVASYADAGVVSRRVNNETGPEVREMVGKPRAPKPQRKTDPDNPCLQSWLGCRLAQVSGDVGSGFGNEILGELINVTV